MSLLEKILLSIGASFAVVIAIIIVWLSLANAHLRTQLAEAAAKNTACRMANDDFQRKAEQQDQAITVLQNETALRARRTAEAEQKAEKTASAYRRDIERLTRQKASGDDCQAANDLLSQYIAGVK